MRTQYNLEYTYEGNREFFEKEIVKDYFIQKEPMVEKVDNGIIVPSPLRDKLNYPKEIASREGGVTDEFGNFIDISARRLLRYKMDYATVKERENIKFVDETVCYLGPIAGYWGHILTEISCCLWYAIENPNMKWAYFDYTDPKVTFIRKPLLDFLELLGIKEEQLVPVTEPTQFSKVIIPEVSAVFGEYYTEKFVRIYDFIRNKVLSTDNGLRQRQKIYLTKVEFESEKGNQIGETAIKKIFEKNGYLCIAPERLSVREQVQLMANASEVVAPEGTLPHNILFCQNDVKLTIINRKMGVNSFQMLINQMRNVQVTYIDCWYMLLPVYHGPYIFMLNDNFQRYAEWNNFSVDIKKNQHVEEYLKIFWYILRYLQIYDLQDKGGQLKKVWNSESVEGFLISRQSMDVLNTEEAQKFNMILQEYIRKIVE